MMLSITYRNFSTSYTIERVLTHMMKKLSKKLTNFVDDVQKVSLVMKKHEKHHYFTSVVTVTLPQKTLVANVGGHSPDEVITAAFEKIFQTFETYKGTHFKGSSKYPHRQSLRTASRLI